MALASVLWLVLGLLLVEFNAASKSTKLIRLVNVRFFNSMLSKKKLLKNFFQKKNHLIFKIRVFQKVTYRGFFQQLISFVNVSYIVYKKN